MDIPFCRIYLAISKEFLRFFLDGLSEDLNRSGKGPPPTIASPHDESRGTHQGRAGASPKPLTDDEISTLTAAELAERAWDLHLARNDSEITSMFGGQLQSCISCLSCGNISYCFDPFFDLSVPLSGRHSPAAKGSGRDEGGHGQGHGRVRGNQVRTTAAFCRLPRVVTIQGTRLSCLLRRHQEETNSVTLTGHDVL